MNRGIAVVGALILDKHFTMATYPEKSSLSRVDRAEEYLGGSGNIILDLAHLDKTLHIQVAGMVGRGTHGRSIRKVLNHYSQIDTSPIKKGLNTSVTLVMNALDDKSRTFFYFPGASDEFSLEDIEWDKLDADIFQLEYLLLLDKLDAKDEEYGTVAAHVLHEAQKRGFITSIDTVSEKSNRPRELIPFALKYTNICCINEREAAAITGFSVCTHDSVINEEQMIFAMQKLKDHGVSFWVVVHCQKCAYGLDCRTNEMYKTTSFDLPKKKIKGTTGAGDAFCAGLIYAFYQEKKIQDALVFASMVAGSSLFAKNGYDGVLSVNQIKAMILTFKGGVCEKIRN